MTCIGVLVPVNTGSIPAPEARPVGRAALALAQEGIEVLFGDRIVDGRMSGLCPIPGGWKPASDVPIQAVHDRYPSQLRSDHYARIRVGIGDIPVGNPPGITELCRDKLACQRWLEAGALELPPVEDQPATFQARLESWGAAFLKPRFGALGTGVRRVDIHSDLPAQTEGLVPGRMEPSILQRAVPPPSGLAGQCVRLLAQRLPGGGWHLCEPVVRQSRTDAVVNAARGAEVGPGSDLLSPGTAKAVKDLARAAARRISDHPMGDLAVELGVDMVIDRHGAAHLIELNSRPRGRLEVLAAANPGRFGNAHVEACARPVRYLAHHTPQTTLEPGAPRR
ncbi:MAG: hypothetical protein QGG40_01390 [Myxococcota bacterium]|nr:hypothetical protein [Myxococcota bacterium]